MKHPSLLLLLMLFFGGLSSSAQDLSNKGKEFWVGYGHHQYFANSNNGQDMVLYFATDNQAAVVTISRANGTILQTVNVPANSSVKSSTIPKSGANDCRLLTEGLSDKGIHIQSDVPITAYAHIYATTSSGATMLMPVETYGYSYYALGSTQSYPNSSGNCYAWFYVIAKENNTRVQIQPSAPTVGGWPANSTQTITLNKGQVYQVLGAAQGSTAGYDLTGSSIKSIANSLGECYPIAVFSGSSRTAFCTTAATNNGGDNMIQQVFPASAWGTKYFTSPTSSSNNVATFMPSVYRVAVREPGTVVKRNGVVLTNLINNFYYEFYSSVGEYIESNKPILVSQNMVSSTCGSFTNTDPETFYLSPLEQAINKVIFYAPSEYAISYNYVNVIVPSAAILSLRIDGGSAFDYSAVHPQNPAYRVVIKRIGSGMQHTVSCDSAFTAITYGLGTSESYGFNAGTLVNNLNSLPALQNVYNTSTSPNTFTCRNTPVNFSVQSVYSASKIVWKFSQVQKITPNADVVVTNPVAADSAVINTRKYYLYDLPQSYMFSDTGTYSIPVEITAPNIDNCSNTEVVMLTVVVKPGPKPDFTVSYSGCVADSAAFSGISLSPEYNITKYNWNFGDSGIDSIQQPKHKFSTQTAHNVKLTLIADNGCFGDSIKVVTTNPSPVATFGYNPINICETGSAVTVTFTDTSSFSGSPLLYWYWDFGNGQTVNATTNATQTSTYTTPGTYTIKHLAGASSCRSDTTSKAFTIYAKPNADFVLPANCLQDSVATFTNTSSVSDGQLLNFQWTFGDPSTGVLNTSIDTNGVHRYSTYGPYPVKLIVTTNRGCIDSIQQPYKVRGFSTPVKYSVVNETQLCSRDAVVLKNEMNVAADSIYRIDIYWDAVNDPAYQTYTSITQGGTFTHNYLPFSTPAQTTYTIKWVVYSKGLCTSDETRTITINAIPTLSYAPLTGVCVNADTISIASAVVTNGVAAGLQYYKGNGVVDSAGHFLPATAGVGTQNIWYVYTTTGGCTDSVMSTIQVYPKPAAAFNIGNNICLGDSVLITDVSTPSSNIVSWNWNFGDGITAIHNNNAPFHYTYTNFGEDSITLYTVSDHSCISDTTASKKVTVYPVPLAGFTLPAAACLPGGAAIFTNTSTIAGTNSNLNYSWNFGDGTATSASKDAVHYYASSGNYPVKLTVTSMPAGCSHDTTINFSAFYQNPTANFSVTPSELCQGTPSIFTDISDPKGSAIAKWNWNFADGVTDSIANPVKIYAMPGVYGVSLIVATTEGCVSPSFSLPVTVHLQPVVDAGDPFLIPEGTVIQFNPTANDSASLHFKWTTDILPTYLLTNDTIFRSIARPLFNRWYRITATGAGNCSATDSVRVVVLKALQIPNTFSPNGDGINDTWEIPYLVDYPGCIVEVYNRGGQRVYRSLGYGKAWDGNASGGQPLPVGTYYYIIEPLNNGYGKLSGSITILR